MSGPMSLRAALLAGVSARALGWRPDDFWSATPAELVTALMPLEAEAPLVRADLERLLESEYGR